MECLSGLLLEVLNSSPNFRGLAGLVEFLQKLSFQLFPVAAPVAAVEISLEVPDLGSIDVVADLDDSVSILRLHHHKLALPPGTGTVVVEVVGIVMVMVVKVVAEKPVPTVADAGCHLGSALPKPSQ
ncbi:hypothetical protein L1887_32050 [Cichorium endivia]|nr:hypothetical protein L1887_32050 [Cichorium endivia]